MTEFSIEILINVHATFGGVALAGGAVALTVTKGNKIHKQAGRLFYYSMLISALLALFISALPGHKNAFLFCIGVFSAYLIISGYRSIRLKKPKNSLLPDQFLSALMILTGIIMIIYPILLEGGFNIILMVFGSLGIVFGLRDFHLFRNPGILRRKWLNRHLGNMTGGYIAAVTAFFVVNDILIGLWNWFLPTVVGTVYISYWIRKLNPRKKR